MKQIPKILSIIVAYHYSKIMEKRETRFPIYISSKIIYFLAVLLCDNCLQFSLEIC